MRSSEKAQWDALKDIVETIKTIPVVANGDVFEFEDIQRLKDHTSNVSKITMLCTNVRSLITLITSISDVSSVMVARGAQWNPSVFRKEGKIDFEDIAKEYLKKVTHV